MSFRLAAPCNVFRPRGPKIVTFTWCVLIRRARELQISGRMSIKCINVMTFPILVFITYILHKPLPAHTHANTDTYTVNLFHRDNTSCTME